MQSRTPRHGPQPPHSHGSCPESLFRWEPLRCRRVKPFRSPCSWSDAPSGGTIRSYHRRPAGSVVKQTARSPSTGTTRPDRRGFCRAGSCCTHTSNKLIDLLGSNSTATSKGRGAGYNFTVFVCVSRRCNFLSAQTTAVTQGLEVCVVVRVNSVPTINTWIYHCGRRETSWVNPASLPTATAWHEVLCCAVVYYGGMLAWQWCGKVALGSRQPLLATLALRMPPKVTPTFSRHDACHPVLIRGCMVGCPERAPGTRGTPRCDTTSAVTNHFLANSPAGVRVPSRSDVIWPSGPFCSVAAYPEEKTQRAWRASCLLCGRTSVRPARPVCALQPCTCIWGNVSMNGSMLR